MFLVSGIFLKESLRYLLYSARSGKVKRLNILEDNSLKTSTNFELNHGDCIIDMSVNGKYIFTGGSDGKLILWTYNELDSKHTRVIQTNLNFFRISLSKLLQEPTKI